jgi:hypothetical protein
MSLPALSCVSAAVSNLVSWADSFAIVVRSELEERGVRFDFEI